MLRLSPPFHGRYVVFSHHSPENPGALFETIQLTSRLEDQEEFIRSFAGKRKRPELFISGYFVGDYETLEQFFRRGSES